jgi:hypothetical protein
LLPWSAVAAAIMMGIMMGIAPLGMIAIWWLADAMPEVLGLVSSVLTVILVVALAREIRLRRALESLLKRLLSYWRTHEEQKPRDVGHQPVDADDSRLHW